MNNNKLASGLNNADEILIKTNAYSEMFDKARREDHPLVMAHCVKIIDDVISHASTLGVNIVFDNIKKEYTTIQRIEETRNSERGIDSKNFKMHTIAKMHKRIDAIIDNKEKELSSFKERFFSCHYSFERFYSNFSNMVDDLKDKVTIIRDLEIEIDVLREMREEIFIDDSSMTEGE